MNEAERTRKGTEIAVSMLKQIKILSECLIDVTEWATFTQGECPIRVAGLSHYNLSRFLADGGIEWTCPLCGEKDSI